jgi:hypothetical protein
MRPSTLFAFLAICLLASCRYQVREVPSLHPSDLYYIDSVRKFIDLYGDPDDDALPQEAGVEAIKTSLLKQPTAQGYFELGSSLMALGQFKEATKALTMAKDLQYTHLPELCYTLSAAYCGCMNDTSMVNPTDSVTYYMQMALQTGYPYPERFLTDSLFWWAREYPEFVSSLKAAVATKRDPDTFLWNGFSARFATMSLPLQMDRNWIDHYQGASNDYIEDLYSGFVSATNVIEFSRMSRPEFFYVGKVHSDSNYAALIYSFRVVWDGIVPTDTTSTSTPHSAPAGFYMTTYDSKGKILDKLQIAGGTSRSGIFRECTLSPGLDLDVTTETLVYAKNPLWHGYLGNNIVGVRVQNLSHYRINPSGHIEKMTVPALARGHIGKTPLPDLALR